MRCCANCGHELKDDEIYCVKCGKALQVVPDYNVLEDEILPNLLSDHPRVLRDGLDAKKSKDAGKRSLKRLAAIFLIVFAVCAVAKLAGPAQTEIEAEEVPPEPKEDPELLYKVEPIFSKAGGEYPDDFELSISAPDGAKIIYAMEGADAASGSGFSEAAGQKEGSDTMEGTNPADDTDPVDGDDAADAAGEEAFKGSVYNEPLKITEGRTIVRAQCVNEDNEKGPVTEKIYVVKYPQPDKPNVLQESGTYHEETYVTIKTNVPGGKIYYTWDGSNPTVYSMLYTEPVLIPEGNHVLSVIVINERNMSSDIARYNYVYIP
ncbi:MAG: chitobiase/beta-hexosaminidase C-terminal domain-containing protein [Lachnospiraceae bacterium]|nr:chitobiase/beta-hexosaminidase C-terminal domain-containing protein [Lachnospiraceae bacterium]